ncbi:MAG: hypothetical protein LC793_07165, partial [Thermomicrobia bacterium]|nr:hypothetical protein [Thermomicrobia bacterium]
IQKTYEKFVQGLIGRTARINYDTKYDMLYVFGMTSSKPESGAKPRPLAVASGIYTDVLLSCDTLHDLEIEGFGRELSKRCGPALIAWWANVQRDETESVEGKRLAEAMQHVSFV